MLEYLIFGITYGFIAAVQPGPLQTYIISQTLTKGWKLTLPVSIAPIISDIPIFFLTIFVLNLFSDSFLSAIRILGGIFLIYLAFKTYSTWKNYNTSEITIKQNNKTFTNAIIVNILNPNPYLGWSLIMGPLFLEGWQISPHYGISLIIGFYLTMALLLVITILLFAFAKKFGNKVSRHLLGLSAVGLVLFGIYQLSVGLKTVI
ncbi:MAG: LysE family transporter [Ignavibacteriae bacterium]|nr:LysE family transporter [Ignavibacteriota bacterium]MCB9208364.1 LysE family transporter [Ignavibacteriales bacterium]MCB9259128.1 LysE family transporter [Ignavibacteriales bacterium]